MIGVALTAFKFLKSKWLPVLLIGLAVIVAAYLLHSRGYQKGVRVTESRMFEERNDALTAQLIELNRVQEIDLKAAVRAATLEAEVMSHVESIEIPAFPRFRCPERIAVPNSMAVGDHIRSAPDPDFSEWLLFFNAAVSADDTQDPG